MMVFWQAQLAMLAVPKTGTQAYEAALGGIADIVIRHPTNMKHMMARRFRNKFVPLLNDPAAESIETMAVIREPQDWLGSWYRYRRRPAARMAGNSTEGLSFDDFIAAYLSEDQPACARIGSQAKFVSSGAGHVIVDHLFAYDNQPGIRAFLADRLGVDVAPDRKNVSPIMPLSLSQELAARLRAERSEDFALYASLTKREG